jgi:uncharacterized surface protein with fasciclin (FAS1) repeats
MRTRSLLVSFALTTCLVGSAVAETPKSPPAKPPAKEMKDAAAKDIVDTAIADGRFTTLVKAVQAAGLVDTLKGKGPFTVFAPTDEAFAKLPADTLKGVLADKAKLTKILTYHVVPGKLVAGDVLKAKSLKTVQGGSLAVDAKATTIGGAKIIVTDVMTSNGVIHAIDTVLLPK